MRILLCSEKEKLSEHGNAAKSNYKRPEKKKTIPRFTHEFSLYSVAISKTKLKRKRERETKRDVRCLRGAEANTHTKKKIYIYICKRK